MGISKCEKVNKETGKVYTYYVADAGSVNGKRLRKTCSTHAEAQQFMRNIKRQREKYGVSATALSSTQYAIANNAFQMLSSAGKCDSDLIEAVSVYLKQCEAVFNSIPLGQAFDAYLKTFDAYGQALHVRTIRGRISPFVHSLGRDIIVANISESDIKDYFDDLETKCATKTYNNALSYIKTFFNWCMEQRYIQETPVVLKCKTIAYEDPVFIRVEDLEAILETLESNTMIEECDRHFLINFITLSFFCGLRSSEIFKLPPEAVHPEDERPFVRVSTTKGAARGIKGRIVDLEPNAALWLKKYPYNKRFDENKMYKIRARLRNLGTDVFEALFVKNVARHSYITYHTAKYRDYARTEAYVGTSASMRCRHYQGLATTAAGEAYFSLYPSS